MNSCSGISLYVIFYSQLTAHSCSTIKLLFATVRAIILFAFVYSTPMFVFILKWLVSFVGLLQGVYRNNEMKYKSGIP